MRSYSAIRLGWRPTWRAPSRTEPSRSRSPSWRAIASASLASSMLSSTRIVTDLPGKLDEQTRPGRARFAVEHCQGVFDDCQLSGSRAG